MMSDFIMKEQFGFLHNNQIHDAVSLTQEALDSIHSKHIPSFILKLNVSKTYDKVNWVYLRLVLI